MTWRRGFFRLWLFLSVIWVAGSVYLLEPKTYKWLWRAPIVVFESPSGQELSIDTAKSRKEIKDEIFAALEREPKPATGPVPPPEKTLDGLLKATDSAAQTKSEEARRAWLITSVPPLALLALGLCIAWIFRGFRPQKSASK